VHTIPLVLIIVGAFFTILSLILPYYRDVMAEKARIRAQQAKDLLEEDFADADQDYASQPHRITLVLGIIAVVAGLIVQFWD
jgi:uncharacterized membrane protein